MPPRLNALLVLAVMPFVWLFSIGILCYDLVRFVIGTIFVLLFTTANFLVHIVLLSVTVVTGGKSTLLYGIEVFLKSRTDEANSLRQQPWRNTRCKLPQTKREDALSKLK